MVWASDASGTVVGGVTNFNGIISGNNLYDPALTLSTRQPLGFDQLKQIYGYYRVHASKVSVIYFGDSSGAASTPMVTLVPRNVNTPEASGYDYYDQPYARYALSHDFYHKGRRLTNYMTTKKIFGVTSLGQESGYYAAIGAGPYNEWYWHINCNTISAGTIPAADRIIIRIVFWCEFNTMNALPQS